MASLAFALVVAWLLALSGHLDGHTGTAWAVFLGASVIVGVGGAAANVVEVGSQPTRLAVGVFGLAALYAALAPGVAHAHDLSALSAPAPSRVWAELVGVALGWIGAGSWMVR